MLRISLSMIFLSFASACAHDAPLPVIDTCRILDGGTQLKCVGTDSTTYTQLIDQVSCVPTVQFLQYVEACHTK